jgi:hypothetical protein
MPWVVCKSLALPSANIANRAFSGEAFQEGLLPGGGLELVPEIPEKFSDGQRYPTDHGNPP